MIAAGLKLKSLLMISVIFSSEILPVPWVFTWRDTGSGTLCVGHLKQALIGYAGRDKVFGYMSSHIGG